MLELQKSNFGNYYMLHIKGFIQGAFGVNYFPSKDLVKSTMGHVNGDETQEFKDVLNLGNTLNDIERRNILEKLFNNVVIPFTNKILTISGIKELEQKGELFVFPELKSIIDKDS